MKCPIDVILQSLSIVICNQLTGIMKSRNKQSYYTTSKILFQPKILTSRISEVKYSFLRSLAIVSPTVSFFELHHETNRLHSHEIGLSLGIPYAIMPKD